jgi:predicted nucleic acid-binding protein
MRCFADTSFLCALYREQDHSERADAFMESRKDQVVVSSQVLWEFRQSARFQVYRYQFDKTTGFSKTEAERMINMLSENVASGILTLATVEWPDVHKIAETLSATHTMKSGHRAMDIIHVSTAKNLGLKHFLTFDDNQKKRICSLTFKENSKVIEIDNERFPISEVSVTSITKLKKQLLDSALKYV